MNSARLQRQSCEVTQLQPGTQPRVGALSFAVLDAVIANYPDQRFTLRNGILVIRQHPRTWPPPELEQLPTAIGGWAPASADQEPQDKEQSSGRATSAAGGANPSELSSTDPARSARPRGRGCQRPNPPGRPRATTLRTILKSNPSQPPGAQAAKSMPKPNRF
jgi:hypothetical protein